MTKMIISDETVIYITTNYRTICQWIFVSSSSFVRPNDPNCIDCHAAAAAATVGGGFRELIN